MTADRTPQPGDWVQVWGLVVEDRNHPDDITVEFHNHGEDWRGVVARDRVELPDYIPAHAEKCSALVPYSPVPDTFTRCVLHDRHAGEHRDRMNNTYTDSEIVGYFEER